METITEKFGSLVFDDRVMKQPYPPKSISLLKRP